MRRRPSEQARSRIALVGPRADARGGVAGSIAALLASPLAQRYELLVVTTHCDGSKARKILCCAHGLLRLSRLCRSRNVDLVHVHSSWNGSLVRKAAAVAIARRHGIPVVLQLHGSGFEHGLHRGTALSSLARRAARAADAVVAATPAWAAESGRLLGVEVQVVPNAATACAPLARRESSRPTVLFLGRIERAKGVFELVEAAAELAETHPGLRLVLAGRGTDEAAVRALAEDRGLGGVVELPGWVGSEAKRRLLSEARCLALPSYAEGLPLALLEAMEGGVPVVASAVGGIPEAARNGREALLVPPGDVAALRDATARLLDNEQLAHRLARAGRARSATYFDAASVATQLAEVYDALLEGPGGRGRPAPRPAVVPQT